MEKIAFGSICVLTLAVVCLATESANESLLKTLLSEESRGQIRAMVNRLVLDQNDPSIDSLLNTENNQPLSSAKRTFCNWIGGCINGKQDSRNNVQKRPFCNGFFGCGNGKRSFDVTKLQDEQQKTPEKRLFCNSFGCINGVGKRSLFAALFDRLRTQPEEKSLSI